MSGSLGASAPSLVGADRASVRGYREFLATHPLLLAPMAGVSDQAFRTLCLEAGASLAFTEMVSAKGLSYANERTSHLLDLGEAEERVGVQLFGHEPDVLAREAAWVEERLGERLAVIDINMGCPARKIVTKGDGSALMEDPELACRIVERCVAATSRVPITAKIRRGFNVGEETAPELAAALEQAGAAAITVHGRYSRQMYAGQADWSCVARVRAAVRVPVIGNGDIVDGQSALERLAQAPVDALMIARGAQGNPWVFSEVAATLAARIAPGGEGGSAEGAAAAAAESTSAFEPPTHRERIEAARRHARLLAERDPRSVVRMRKHGAWYCKGIPGASYARGALNECATLEQFESVLDALEERLGLEVGA